MSVISELVNSMAIPASAIKKVGYEKHRSKHPHDLPPSAGMKRVRVDSFPKGAPLAARQYVEVAAGTGEGARVKRAKRDGK